MDPLRFDRFTRAFARSGAGEGGHTGGSSRRQVLRGVVAGAVSIVAFSRVSLRVAAALCPNRVPRPGYRPTVNGCGPSGYGWVIPDSYGDANWTPACNRHDRCYGTCNESRLKCDFLMRKSMVSACKRAYPGGQNAEIRGKCIKRAWFYFTKVSNNGQSAFEDAQEEACICCTGGSTRCGDRCCDTHRGWTCHDPANSVCCYPGSTACGTGCCTTNPCYECVGGQCRYKCEGFDWCDRNGVCQNCPEDTGCGG